MKNKNNTNPLKYNISKCFFIFMSFIKDKITLIHHLCIFIDMLQYESERQPTNRNHMETLHSFVDENDKKIYFGTK